jgi:hypothetical protein
MEKIVLLKTQLVEAAQLGKSDEFRFKRLSVILLDNFIEIQLSGLIKEKFSWDGIFYLNKKKYKQKQRRRILDHYNELLKACTDEEIITKNESFLLSFCHDVRNNLYHSIREEELLVDVALRVLHEIISKKQPDWKHAKGLVGYSSEWYDPYSRIRNSGIFFDHNSKEEWEYFLNKYFNFIDGRKSSAPSLLSKSIIYKIRETRRAYRFVKKEYHIFFPYAEGWEFNDFLLHYSFKNINYDKIEEIKEIKGRSIQQKKYEQAFEQYEKTWRYKRYDRLKKIENKAIEMLKLDTFHSLEKYISQRMELNMIHMAMRSAAIDLDGAIQHAIDVARGK